MSQKKKKEDIFMCLRHEYVTNLEENKRDHVTRKRAENNHRMCFMSQRSLIRPDDLHKVIPGLSYKALIFIFMRMNRLDSLHISVVYLIWKKCSSHLSYNFDSEISVRRA